MFGKPSKLCMYKTFQTVFLRCQKTWFHGHDKVATAIWWIRADQVPTINEADQKLNYLQKNVVSEKVFDLRRKFTKPDENVN